jgi:CRISPR-associated protein Cmr2
MQFDLHGLSDTETRRDIKQRSFDHFSGLLIRLGAQGDAPQKTGRKTLLAYWRFGPDLLPPVKTDDNGKLGALWNLLPADTRVPDHSIWDHLDLTSAFAGAFAADPEARRRCWRCRSARCRASSPPRAAPPTCGPARICSRLAWEAMRPVCEELGRTPSCSRACAACRRWTCGCATDGPARRSVRTL